MSGAIGKLVAVVTMGAVIVTTACLGTLPEPVKCPADAVLPPCTPPAALAGQGPPPAPGVDTTFDAGKVGAGGPSPIGPPIAPAAPAAPGVGPAICAVDFAVCERAGRSCACKTDCTRGEATCSPAPDCPLSVSESASGATCVETTAGFGPDKAAQCSCGCASCSTTCDGQGPVLGPSQVISYTLPSGLPARGRLGLMVRMRNEGRVTFTIRSSAAPPSAFGEARGAPVFTDTIVRTGASSFSWSDASQRPVAIELIGDPVAAVEVDCVVPFLAP